MKRVIISISLILVSIASIVLGIVCFGMKEGGYPSYTTYGGDAYTGIQNAGAATARNVSYGNEILRFGFGSILVIAGAVMLGIGIANASDNKNKSKKDNEVTTDSMPAKTICASCGKESPYSEGFCINCGNPLSGE